MKKELQKRIDILRRKWETTDWSELPRVDELAIRGMLSRMERLYDDLYGVAH